MLKLIKYILSLPGKLYKWSERLADSKHAERSLYLLTASEAIFFPIPPDPLLMAMIFHNNSRWLRYSLLTIVATIIGGIIGYIIGWTLFESVGDWIITNLHIQDNYNSLSDNFRENGAIVVFAAALTPIPYKVVTLTAGASGVNFGVFLLASIVGRSIRFLAVGALAHYLGKRHKEKIEEYINRISVLIVLLVVLFLLVR